MKDLKSKLLGKYLNPSDTSSLEDLLSTSEQAQMDAEKDRYEQSQELQGQLAQLQERERQQAPLGILANGVGNLQDAIMSPFEGMRSTFNRNTPDSIAKANESAQRNRVNIRGIQKEASQSEVENLLRSQKLKDMESSAKVNMANLPINQIKERVNIAKLTDPESSKATRGMGGYSEINAFVNGEPAIIIRKRGEGQFYFANGTPVPQGAKVEPYSNARTFTDPATGEVKGFNATTASVLPLSGVNRAPDMLPGETVNAMKDRKGVENTRNKAFAADEVDNDRLRRIAEQEVVKFDNLMERMSQAYEEASLKGPLAGVFPRIASSIGWSLDDAATELNTGMLTWANNYIKSISGATVTDKEFETRLKPLLPSSAMDASTFNARRIALKNMLEAERDAIERRYARGGDPSAPLNFPRTGEELDAMYGEKPPLLESKAPNAGTNNRGRTLVPVDSLDD